MTDVYRFGRYELSPATRQLLIDHLPAPLGARAFDVLLALIERRDRLVTKNELLDLVWPGLVVEENNLQVQISALRKALGTQAVSTIPGRGYRFAAALEGDSAPAPSHPWGPVAASSAAAGTTLTNLPEELPLLYGRDEDLTAMRLLTEAHKLVTIVGASGIGKTRLARATAHAQRDRYIDGVWFVDLAPVGDQALVASTVASALNLRLGVDSQTDAVAEMLRTNEMLIVLDNCEHLLEGVAALATTLHRVAPRLRLLTTSQVPLKIPDEQMYRLGNLALPVEPSAASALQSGAVALFTARLQAVDPRFELNDENVGDVIDICRRLDGIALAIELAAARVPLLGIAGLRGRLDERFRILTGGARLALPRHQTLRAALEWSHGLLTTDEQVVFRRLGVFAGTFGLDSAQRVGADGVIDQWTVLEILGNLVDKSLVVADAGREPRYRLLETSRAFALEQLAAASATEDALRAHTLAVLATFDRSHQERWTVPTQARLERYLPDVDNLRAALDWAAGPHGDSDVLVALAGAACWLWTYGGLEAEGLRRCEQVIARFGTATAPRLTARLYLGYAEMSFNRSTPAEKAQAAALHAVELYRELGDRQGLYLALVGGASLHARTGDLAVAEAAIGDASQLYDAAWPLALRQPMLSARSLILSANGRLPEVRAGWEERLRLAGETGDTHLMVYCLNNLVDTVLDLGDVREAIALGRQLVEMVKRERISGSLKGFALGNMSAAYTAAGQFDEALNVARESMPLLRQAGAIVGFIDHFAMLAFRRGRIAAAARTLGCAETMRTRLGYRRGHNAQRDRDVLMQSLQNELAAAELDRLLQEGAGLTDETAAELALAD